MTGSTSPSGVSRKRSVASQQPPEIDGSSKRSRYEMRIEGEEGVLPVMGPRECTTLTVAVPLGTFVKSILCVPLEEATDLAGFIFNHKSILKAIGVDNSNSIYYEKSDCSFGQWLDRTKKIRTCCPPGYCGKKIKRPTQTITYFMRDLTLVIYYIHCQGYKLRGKLKPANFEFTGGKLQLKDILVRKTNDSEIKKGDFAKVRRFLIDYIFGNTIMAYDVEHFLSLLKNPRTEVELLINHPATWTVKQRASMYQDYYNDAKLYIDSDQFDIAMDNSPGRADIQDWEVILYSEPFMPVSEFCFGQARRPGGKHCTEFIRAFRSHAGRFKAYNRFEFIDMEDQLSILFPEMLIWMTKDIIRFGCHKLLPRYQGKM